MALFQMSSWRTTFPFPFGGTGAQKLAPILTSAAAGLSSLPLPPPQGSVAQNATTKQFPVVNKSRRISAAKLAAMQKTKASTESPSGGVKKKNATVDRGSLKQAISALL